MSERSELPPSAELDAYHAAMVKAHVDYLRDKTTREERKDILKEAIDEWLDKKYIAVGKWTVAGIIAACLAIISYAYLMDLGWRHK